MGPSENQIFVPPWSTPELWLAAHDAFVAMIDKNREKLDELRELAYAIRLRIEALDPILEDLCRSTCFDCTDSCCRRAWVWFDFKDLLVMHLAEDCLPAGQPRGVDGKSCRYLSHSGCGLPRVQRPYVCTWYICEAQKMALRRKALSMNQFLTNSLTAIKAGRAEMEGRLVSILSNGY